MDINLLVVLPGDYTLGLNGRTESPQAPKSERRAIVAALRRAGLEVCQFVRIEDDGFGIGWNERIRHRLERVARRHQSSLPRWHIQPGAVMTDHEHDKPIARERWDAKTVKMLLKLPEPMWLELHRIARREQESASSVARRAIRLYIATDRAVESHFFGPLNNEEE